MIPSGSFYDLNVHLSIGDIVVDSSSHSFVCDMIKQLNTDPLWELIYLLKEQAQILPVAALLDYLQARGTSPDPLFHFADECHLTKQHFIVLGHDTLQKADVDQSKVQQTQVLMGWKVLS